MRRAAVALAALLALSVAAMAADRAKRLSSPAVVAPVGPHHACAPQKVRGKGARAEASRACRLSPDSVTVLQAGRQTAARGSAKRAIEAHGADTRVPQVPGSAIRRVRTTDESALMSGEAVTKCRRSSAGRLECSRDFGSKDFVRALTVPPAADTVKTLEEHAIPAIDGVPPIVILDPERVRRIERAPDQGMSPDLFFNFGGSLP